MTKIIDLDLPIPTDEDPWCQVDYIFNKYAELNLHNRQNVKTAFKFYKYFLENSNNYDEALLLDQRFYLNEQWDCFALIKIGDFVDECRSNDHLKKYSSATLNNNISCIRLVMNHASLHGLTKDSNIFNIKGITVVAETSQNAAYSESEMDSINTMLIRELKQSSDIISRSTYQKTGVGKDPRIRHRFSKYYEDKSFGWQNFENLIWYFENVMDCHAHFSHTTDPINKRFYLHMRKIYPDGFQKFFNDYNVQTVVTPDAIMPLAMKLMLETGINSSSLLNLSVDCYGDHHPLSKVPFIKFYKARSKGDMEMHLNIYDKNVSIREFKVSQASIIKRTIDSILEMTKKIRESAPKELKSYLFIYQIGKKNYFGSIIKLNDKASSVWCREKVKTYALKNNENQKLQLSMNRFRSTRITDMVKRGYDFFEIQHHFGHSSIRTTLKYISKNNLEIDARRNILAALDNISKNSFWVKSTNTSYAACQTDINKNNIIYKGLISDCRNVFDPPEDVKKSKNYSQGQACTRYNMCLFCKNVIIMKHHLPTLVRFRDQVNSTVGHNSSELPNLQFYKNSISVINKLLDPTVSEFSEADILWAIAESKNNDALVDPVVFRPVLL